MSMVDLYYELSRQNALEDSDFLEECLTAYKHSDRPHKNFKDNKRYSNFYEFLTTNKMEDKTEINYLQYEEFYVKMTNRWIQNIKKLDKEEIDDYSIEGPLYLKLRSEFKITNQVRNLKEVERLYSKLERKYGENINYVFWSFVQNKNNYPKFNDALNSFTHIASKYTKADQYVDIPNVDYRLYINCANRDLFKLTDEYIKICEEKNIPYLLKYTVDPRRKEKFLVYSSAENLKENIEILREIGRKHPSIIKNCGPNSVITGNIDNWIGLASEPKTTSKKSISFNKQRAQILEDAAENMIINYIKENYNRRVTYLNVNIPIKDLLSIKASEIVMSEMSINNKQLDISYQRKLIDKLNKIDSDGESLLTIALKKLELISTDKNLTVFENRNPIFNLKTKEDKDYDFTVETIDRIIKSFLNVLEDIEPNLIELYRNEIRKLCKSNHIDPDNFSLNDDSLKQFKNIDSKEIDVSQVDDERSQLLKKVNRIIFNIIVSADIDKEIVRVRKQVEEAIDLIEIFKDKYKEPQTVNYLIRNLNLAINIYEEKTEYRLSKPKHMKEKSKEEEEIEEIIKHMASLSEAQKEMLLETIEENRYKEEEFQNPKHL